MFNGWPTEGRQGPLSQGALERDRRAALRMQARSTTEQRLMNLASGEDLKLNSEDNSGDNGIQGQHPHRMERPLEAAGGRGEVTQQGGPGAGANGQQDRQAGSGSGQNSYRGPHINRGRSNNRQVTHHHPQSADLPPEEREYQRCCEPYGGRAKLSSTRHLTNTNLPSRRHRKSPTESKPGTYPDN